MHAVSEIVLPETKPAMEWIGGRPVQKVSPTRKHSFLQLAFGTVLTEWATAENRGEVGTEWRFRLSPPGENRRPLVPDVAFISYDRLDPLSEAQREAPPVAPEIVVEILSLDDRVADVVEKRRVYFASGVMLEIVVDPTTRTADFYHDADTFVRIDDSVASYTPAAFPTLQLPIRNLFAVLDYRGRKG